MRGRTGLVFVGALGCSPVAMSGGTETETDEGTSGGGTSMTAPPMSTTTNVDGGTTGDPGETTGAGSCGTAGCDGAGSSTGEGIVLPCGLEALAPGVRSPVMTGDGPGVLPVEIGTIIESYCGCHLVEDSALLLPKTPPYTGMIRFRTWEQFHQPFGAGPTYLEVYSRVIEQLSMPPVYQCDSFDYGSLLAEDYDTFAAWLAADAPDAASWNP